MQANAAPKFVEVVRLREGSVPRLRNPEVAARTCEMLAFPSQVPAITLFNRFYPRRFDLAPPRDPPSRTPVILAIPLNSTCFPDVRFLYKSNRFSRATHADCVKNSREAVRINAHLIDKRVAAGLASALLRLYYRKCVDTLVRV